MTASGASSLDRLLIELADPVALLGATQLTRQRLEVLLDRAEVRAWQIEASDAPGPLAGCCPRGSGRALLALARAPSREPVPGAYLVARSLPVAPARWVLLGRAAVVPPRASVPFEQLLGSLRAPRGEFWRVHGGVLAQAARAA